MNKNKRCVFDEEHSLENRKRWYEFLNTFLPQFIKTESLKSAIDVGCGIGQFSNYLANLDLKVTAFDVRLSNISEAKKRYPNVKFLVYNAEGPSVSNLGSFDLVFCVGLLYHLENPSLVIRNLYSLTQKHLLLETWVIPSKLPICALFEESFGEDQSLNYTALRVSESYLIKMLYKVGFPYVYKLVTSPDLRGLRHSPDLPFVTLLVSKVGIRMPMPIFSLCPEPKALRRRSDLARIKWPIFVQRTHAPRHFKRTFNKFLGTWQK